MPIAYAMMAVMRLSTGHRDGLNSLRCTCLLNLRVIIERHGERLLWGQAIHKQLDD